MRPKGQFFDLESFRTKHKLSQKAIAEAVHRPQSFLSAIESGRRSAPPALLDELVNLYDEDNISDYLHDREEPSFGDVQNVRDAIVNSPGGVVLVNEFGNKLSDKEMMRILQIEEEARKQIEEDRIAVAPPVQNQPTASVEDFSTVANLVNLLTASEARSREYQDRIKELEAQVLDLQAQLEKTEKK